MTYREANAEDQINCGQLVGLADSQTYFQGAVSNIITVNVTFQFKNEELKI